MKDESELFERIFSLRCSDARQRTLADGECWSQAGRRCTLCAASQITYEQEVAIKTAALHEYWKAIGGSPPLDPLRASPLGRDYRTVTKRKAFHSRERTEIGLIDPTERGQGRFDPLRCAIEPADHAAVYAAVRDELTRPALRPLAEHLSYVIVKGTYSRLTVLLNVREIGPGSVRAANVLSKRLSSVCKNVASSFLFEGDTDDRYYQEVPKNRQARSFRKLFGQGDITVMVDGKRLTYPPLSFSQVNHSMLDHLVTAVRDLLEPERAMTLYDLYCGYGLFTLTLAPAVRSAIGVERSVDSVRAARANAVRLGLRNVRFFRADISPQAVEITLRDLAGRDAVILDPPRHGTGRGILEAIAALRPAKVLHLFCNIRIVADDLRRWSGSGYRLSRALPLDMFPGTPNVELLLLFTRR